MKATDLYNQLERDFVAPTLSEYSWSDYMAEIEEYICDNFKQRNMGLLCDFANEVNSVYTAVFPSDNVLTKILNDNVKDSMLFLHHPSVWDTSKDPDNAFYQMNTDLLEALKERRVSLFNFHVPLDNFGVYATSKTLARRLGISIESTFAEYYGALCGVIGTTDCKNVQELSERYTQAVGHETKLYQYGENSISAGKVAIAAGGGTDTFVLNELIEKGIDTLITGVTLDNKYTRFAHEMAKENAINILGGTHYSSEKFACMEVCEYFDGLGLPATFVEDAPCFEDL